jgi:hypothetical protein
VSKFRRAILIVLGALAVAAAVTTANYAAINSTVADGTAGDDGLHPIFWH